MNKGLIPGRTGRGLEIFSSRELGVEIAVKRVLPRETSIILGVGALRISLRVGKNRKKAVHGTAWAGIGRMLAHMGMMSSVSGGKRGNARSPSLRQGVGLGPGVSSKLVTIDRSRWPKMMKMCMCHPRISNAWREATATGQHRYSPLRNPE